MPNQSDMQPIFKEKEENGIYTATLDGTTDNGVAINETLAMDVRSMELNAIERYVKLGLSFKAIDVELKEFIKKEKQSQINYMTKRFNDKALIYSV